LSCWDHVKVVSNDGVCTGTVTSWFHHSENANCPANCGPLACAAFPNAIAVSDVLTLQSHFGDAFDDGVSVSKRSLEQILPGAAQDFDAFYQQRSPEPATGTILVAAVDCKGIPMVKPPGAQPTPRLTKGQKANKKRMATVAAVFTRTPWVRTPQQVVESLFRISRPTPEDAPVPPRPENKRVWASRDD
jgi:hypothetical protein